MWKNIWKKYGKIISAAVFLTVAGLYYGFVEKTDNAVFLRESEQISMLRNDEIVGLNSESEELESTEIKMEDVEGKRTKSKCIYVHICGEVKNPGVYELSEGSRIFEAVEAAGGLTENADDTSLNLAEKISDGMQIRIFNYEEAEEQARESLEEKSSLINLNTASKEQLMTLSGIGESRADDIIRYREESGGFQTIEEIKKVPGIKEAAYLKIKDSITV